MVVEFQPGREPRVSIDEHAEIVARVRATRAVEAGQPVTLADFDQVTDIRPRHVDRDSGWICFAKVGDSRIVAYDFRRNRERASRLIQLAREYLATARDAEAAGRIRPAVENAYAAAELAVTAEMLVFVTDRAPKGHEDRRKWWTQWTRLGNAPSEHGRALADLASRRRAARYGEGSARAREQFLSGLLSTVEEMIENAAESAADRRTE